MSPVKGVKSPTRSPPAPVVRGECRHVAGGQRKGGATSPPAGPGNVMDWLEEKLEDRAAQLAGLPHGLMGAAVPATPWIRRVLTSSSSGHLGRASTSSSLSSPSFPPHLPLSPPPRPHSTAEVATEGFSSPLPSSPPRRLFSAGHQRTRRAPTLLEGNPQYSCRALAWSSPPLEHSAPAPTSPHFPSQKPERWAQRLQPFEKLPVVPLRTARGRVTPVPAPSPDQLQLVLAHLPLQDPHSPSQRGGTSRTQHHVGSSPRSTSSLSGLGSRSRRPPDPATRPGKAPATVRAELDRAIHLLVQQIHQEEERAQRWRDLHAKRRLACPPPPPLTSSR
mgnify:FL=1